MQCESQGWAMDSEGNLTPFATCQLPAGHRIPHAAGQWEWTVEYKPKGNTDA